MKINIKITTHLIFSSLLFLGTGCEKFLEEPDRSNFTLENYFTKAEHAESVVNATYESLRTVRGEVTPWAGAAWLMLEFQTGLANTEYGQAVNSINVRNLVNTADNNYNTVYWNSNYRGIGNANLAIAKIPEIAMDETRKKKLLGEARFLRAYYYYTLVRVFGKIPLITLPVSLTSPELYPEPASVEEIYNLIVADLIEAEASGLPYTDPSGRVTLGAIKSLLSSVYLTMAGFPLQKGTEYYQKAADKANEVITSNQFFLFASYDDLHKEETENRGENIFMVQFEPFAMPSYWQSIITPYNRGISTYADETGSLFANLEFIGSYEPGDKRTREKQFYYKTYTQSEDRTKIIDLGGYYIYKHFDISANEATTSSGLNWPIMRYAEVLLTYAEASNEVSGPSADAYEAVNKIRRRAELPELTGLSKEQFREAIWRERWHELSFENVTWFDMVRLQKAYNVKTNEFDNYVGHQFTYGPVLKDRELLFPIPAAEIRNNSKLVQNPGY
jgi:hypothetical protein